MDDRYQFQRAAVLRVTGKVLNAGCKEDPCGLKRIDPERVVNLDMRTYDDALWHTEGRKVPLPVDIVHNLRDIPWPFENDEFDLVVFGDILEDLPDNGCQLDILRETARVSKAVCITTPEDTPERDWHHMTTITAEKLQAWLEETGWHVDTFKTVDYGFVPRGHLVFAVRADVIIKEKG